MGIEAGAGIAIFAITKALSHFTNVPSWAKYLIVLVGSTLLTWLMVDQGFTKDAFVEALQAVLVIAFGMHGAVTVIEKTKNGE